MRDIEKAIDIINKLIFESIIYRENDDDLLNVLNKWIARQHLSDKYTAKTVRVYANYPAMPQIISISRE